MRASLLLVLQWMLLFVQQASGQQVLQLNVLRVTQSAGSFIALIEDVGDQVLVLGSTALGKQNGKGKGKGGQDCPILNLELGPIHLNLLGLDVTTSQICLAVNAQQNNGLLGELLCGLANALNDGDLLEFLGGLSPSDLSTLLDGLRDILNSVLARVTTVGGPGNAVATLLSRRQSCPILRLSLGPINLNLLGLVVDLDNCNNGAVTVDITAVTGALLGNLLCEIASLDLSTNEIVGLVRDLIGSITNPPLLSQLTNLVHQITGDGLISRPELRQLVNLFGKKQGGIGKKLALGGAIVGPIGLGAATLYGLRRRRRVKVAQPSDAIQDAPRRVTLEV